MGETLDSGERSPLGASSVGAASVGASSVGAASVGASSVGAASVGAAIPSRSGDDARRVTRAAAGRADAEQIPILETEAGFAGRAGRERQAPGDERDRHRAAVAQTLSSARASAARGDYMDALSWLSMLDAIGHELSDEDEQLRVQWQQIIAARHRGELSS
jgi:hypothetical protein